jgi:hypothetical protein
LPAAANHNNTGISIVRQIAAVDIFMHGPDPPLQGVLHRFAECG